VHFVNDTPVGGGGAGIGRSATAPALSSKTKFTCSECEQDLWAKLGALPICEHRYEDGEGDIHLMPAETEAAGDVRRFPPGASPQHEARGRAEEPHERP